MGRAENGLGVAFAVTLVGLVVKLSYFRGSQVGIVPHVISSTVVVVILGDRSGSCFTHIRVRWYYKEGMKASLLVSCVVAMSATACDFSCLDSCSSAPAACASLCGCHQPAPFLQLKDQTIEVHSCSDDCKETCRTSGCLSLCLAEFCSAAETGQVTYFLLGVVLFLGLISLSYEVLYSKAVKSRLQKRTLNP